MADTLTAPAPSGTIAAPATPAAAPATPVAPVVPAAPTAPQTIAEAGAAFKAAESWNELGFPSMAVTDGEETPAPGTAATEEKPDALPSPDEGPEFVQNAQGQWHRPDGTFANADEIAAIEAQIASDASAPATPAAEAPAPEAKDNIVTIRTRDGKTRDVVIEDPELAQEIRQNMNDGMRRKEYQERVGVVEAKLAELRQLDAMIEKNPEAVIQRSLSPEQKVRLATMLLAEHFDELVPIIRDYDTNPTTRVAAVGDAQRRMREQDTEFQTFTAAQTQAQAVRGAVEALLPESIDGDVAQSFWADASMDLQRAIARGDKVEPATVPQLLAARLKLYGITAPAGSVPAGAAVPRILAAPVSPVVPPASVPASPSSPVVATPANDPAKALADVKAGQRRIQLTQRHRANAAAVPPVGAGAAPVRLPPVPANATIEEAARAMKKVRSWAS